MSIKKKLGLGILAGLTILVIIFLFLRQTFFSEPNIGSMTGTENSAMNPDGTPVEGGMLYTTYNLFSQDPVTVNASVKLQTETAYFYNAEQGEIESILVKDGQIVKKGAVLYNYKSTNKEAKYALEDNLREQTKLYNQREELINQLGKLTGSYYNYQGDQIAYYWDNGGKQVYYIVEAIGQSTLPTATSSQQNDNASENVQENSNETATNNGADTESIKAQIRQINGQIEELEIKQIRQQEQQNGKVIAKSDGKVILNEAGRDNHSIPLIRIASEEVAVVGSVNEYDFYTLAQDREVTIFIPAENRTIGGKIISYDTLPAYSGGNNSSNGNNANFTNANSGGDSSSAQFNFVVKPNELIQPGFSAKVNITLPGFVIPKDTIVEENGKSYVFVYRDGKAYKTAIELMQQGIQKVVLKGLTEGDQLVMMPYDLQDGQEISVMEPMMMDEMPPMVEGGQ